MGNEVRDGFVRQRRNLIIGSFLLLFAEVANITVDKIIVFGNEINLAHKYSITATLWVVIFYWLIRFYQYSRDLNSTDEISSAETVKFNSYMPDVALQCLRETRPELFMSPPDKPGATLTAGIKDYSCLEARKHFHRGRIELEIAWNHEEKTGFYIVGPIEIMISEKYLRNPRRRAKLNIYIHTTKFTEYILPFVVFSLPVLYGLFLLIDLCWQSVF